MIAADRTTSVEYRTILRLHGFRFGSDASVQTRWMLGVKKQLGHEWRTLKPSPRPTGHSWFYVGPQKTTKPLRLDEAICEAFNGERPPGTECLHRDGDNTNCKASNLYWGVAPENIRDPSVEYRTILECEGYDFGDDGSLWSYWGTGFDKPSDVPRRMNPTPLDSGHVQVTVRWNGEMRRFGAHHLICIAFHGPCPEGMECCHNDGIPFHNWASNLRWGTPKDNAQDQIKHGVFVQGEKHWAAKMNKHKVRAMRDLHAKGVSTTELAIRYGISWNSANKIIQRQSWKHVI